VSENFTLEESINLAIDSLTDVKKYKRIDDKQMMKCNINRAIGILEETLEDFESD